MKIFLCLRWNMIWLERSRLQELAKPQAWGCPCIPLFFQVISCSIISNLCSSFTIMIFCTLVGAMFLFAFCFAWLFYCILFLKLKYQKYFVFVYLVFLCFFFCLFDKTKTTKIFSFFFAFSWLFLASFCILIFWNFLICYSVVYSLLFAK